MNAPRTATSRDDWRTPRWLLAWFRDTVHKHFPFPCMPVDLFPPASQYRTDDWEYIDEYTDAIGASYDPVWLNPPYGQFLRHMPAFQRALIKPPAPPEVIVWCVPARTETRWFHALCTAPGYNTLFVLPAFRVRFDIDERAKSQPQHATALIVHTRPTRDANAFRRSVIADWWPWALTLKSTGMPASCDVGNITRYIERAVSSEELAARGNVWPEPGDDRTAIELAAEVARVV